MLPFFYHPTLPDAARIELDADTSHHIAQVLRMQAQEPLHLTDGTGTKVTGRLMAVSKRACILSVEERTQEKRSGRSVHLAIAPLKNNSRLEWLIEKATELGVESISMILTDRTEKQRIRTDRLRQLAIAAMLQSQQVWLPRLDEPLPFADLIRSWSDSTLQRLIAHCAGMDRQPIASCSLSQAVGILIGPEGDFSEREIATALEAGFMPVQLGATRLRTETAGVAAATWLRLQSSIES